MDDTGEAEVLRDAALILVRQTWRAYRDVRAGVLTCGAELWHQTFAATATRGVGGGVGGIGGGGGGGGVGGGGRGASVFVPATLTLFLLGLVAAAARNDAVQAGARLLLRLLRRLARRLKTAARAALHRADLLAIGGGDTGGAGAAWEERWPSGGAACFAVQGRRPKMEDRFTLVEHLAKDTPLQLFAVYDGHGGEFAADYAQKWIAKCLEERAAGYHSVRSVKTPKSPAAPSFVKPSSKQPKDGEPEATPSPTPTDDAGSAAADGAAEEAAAPAEATAAAATAAAAAEAAAEAPKTPAPRKKLHFDVPSTPEGGEPKTMSGRRGSLAKEGVAGSRGGVAGVAGAATAAKRASLTPKASIDEYDMASELSSAVQDSDKALLVQAKKANDVSGSTALVAMLDTARGRLAVANLGDSRGILCDSKGTVIPLSFDHKPQQLKERKRIQEAGGFISFNGVWRVAGILATSRALGDFPLKDRKLLIAEPDVLSFDLADLKLKAPSFAILASDGLWDAFSNEEAARFVRWRLHEPHLGARSLALQAFKRGSVDNITVLVINLSTIA